MINDRNKKKKHKNKIFFNTSIYGMPRVPHRLQTDRQTANSAVVPVKIRWQLIPSGLGTP